MIRDLSIKNYRCFEDFYVDGLAQVNLIVGDNNSGKTSFLEAIYLLVNQPKTKNEKVALVDILEHRGEMIEERTHKFTGNNRREISHFQDNFILNNLYYGYPDEFDTQKAYIISISSEKEQSIHSTIRLYIDVDNTLISDLSISFLEEIGKEQELRKYITHSVDKYVPEENLSLIHI